MVGVMIGLYPLGVLCHELVGHGLTGVAFGGRIERVEILGLDVWPRLHWAGWQGHYGNCEVRDVASPAGEQWMALGGALSTWAVSVAALVALRLGRWRQPARAVLTCLSLWWIDMLTYTLPSWGLRRSVFWGQRTFSEPYEAAVALGMPGWLFQMVVVASSALLAGALVVTIWKKERPTGPSLESPR